MWSGPLDCTSFNSTVAFITILSGCIIIIEKKFKKSRKLLRRWIRSKNDLPKCKWNNFKNKVSNKKGLCPKQKIWNLSILASFGPVLTNQRRFNRSYFEYWAYMLELWAEIQNHYWRRAFFCVLVLKFRYSEKVTQISQKICQHKLVVILTTLNTVWKSRLCR